MKYVAPDLSKWQKKCFPEEILEKVNQFCVEWKIPTILYLTDISTTTSKEYRLMYKDDGGHVGCELFRI